MGLLNTDAGNLVYIVPQSSYYYTTGTQDESVEDSDDFIFATLTEKQDARLILSATEFFEKTETAVSTNYPVSSSGSQGDHYRPNGPVITFRGVISESLTNLVSALEGFGKDPESLIEAYIAKIRDTLRMMKDDNGNRAFPLVNIHLPDGNTENNCLITSFKISRDVKVGNGYYVDITAKKLLITDSLFSVVPATDSHQSSKKTSSSTADVEQYEELTAKKTIWPT